MKLFLIISFIVASSNAHERRFPEDFLFGAATAAYQIEGGWNADDKSENIWDRMTHTKPHVIEDMSNGDVAANTYINYKRDVEMMRELGLDVYRFSLSWSRILPNGLANHVSEAGVNFYNNYINEMLKYNITPMVTLYHWDLPQKLQDFGGLLSPLFPEWFEDYARIAFQNFGDRVKHWITFNEPYVICAEGYGGTDKAPILNITDVGSYYCAKYLMIGHARAYHAYVNEFKTSQNGICGISNNVNWFEAATDSEEDEFAAKIIRQAAWGLYSDPIYSKEGGFPKELSDIVAQKSIEQGYPRSRMPEFTEEEKKLIQGTSDFFGINHYTTLRTSATENKVEYPIPSLLADIDVGLFADEDWPIAASSWLKLAPNSIYNAVMHIAKMYNNPIIYITESGWSTSPKAGLTDDYRISYYRAALSNVLDILEADVKLKGYMAWSLMDNFEWMAGYTVRFGLYEVDFESPERTRTPRKSAFVYKEIIRSRVIDPDYEPTTLEMWIDEGH